ncbi:MAG: phosphoribosylformylglycinamidine synthase I [Candidatus Aenigmarchaeota archaeon]|nr:phosphoribosylformylglycinamidine synthase I [Candidatus Aenigmarchaeota archaeon]
MRPRVLTLYGQGINCDRETARAFGLAGADARRVLVNYIAHGKDRLGNYDILVVPGGFSYGDDLSAGKILALQMTAGFGEQMQQFIADGKPVMGICNGFQVLVKTGLLPGFDGNYRAQTTTLTNNDSGRFEDRWVDLLFDDSPCIFTRGIRSMKVPVRHGEGKLYAAPETIERLGREHQVVARYAGADWRPAGGRYPMNPNGSLDDIAGICDPTGRVFGWMPHAEAATDVHHYPTWMRDRKAAEENAEKARQMFRNAVDYVRG